MIPYQKEKIENAILFFAKEHRKKTRKHLLQTFLYKYLAFLDFKSLEEIGQPALGLTYRAMEYGPVPIEIYDKRFNYNTDSFKFIAEDKKIRIIPKDKSAVNFDYFSEFEIELMKNLIEIYASGYVDTNMISDCSHKEIRAWNRAYQKQKNSIIDYSLSFKDDIYNKSPKNLTSQEESYTIYSTLARK